MVEHITNNNSVASSILAQKTNIKKFKSGGLYSQKNKMVKIKTIKGYKFIQSDMKSRFGDYKWKVGKWYKLDEDKIELCKYGFHACLEPQETLDFVYGDKFFTVEARGKIIYDKGVKFVASEMRLIKELQTSQIFKLFSIWNAKQHLKHYEKQYKNDSRISDCIKTSEDYLNDKASLSELLASESVVESVADSARFAEELEWATAELSRVAALSVRSVVESVVYSAAWSAFLGARLEKSTVDKQNKKLKELINKYNKK
jgi:hypothetical protein